MLFEFEEASGLRPLRAGRSEQAAPPGSAAAAARPNCGGSRAMTSFQGLFGVLEVPRSKVGAASATGRGGGCTARPNDAAADVHERTAGSVATLRREDHARERDTTFRDDGVALASRRGPSLLSYLRVIPQGFAPSQLTLIGPTREVQTHNRAAKERREERSRSRRAITGMYVWIK